MANCKNPTDFEKMLGRDTPPGDEELIALNLEILHDPEFHDDYTFIHAAGCDMGTKNIRIEHTTGRGLRQLLDGYREVMYCEECFSLETLEHFNLLLNGRGPYPDDGGVDGEVSTNCTMLVFYESWKPDYVNEWCQWFCGKTPDQIREEAKQELDWNNKPGGRQLACFGVYVGAQGGDWIVGVGDTIAKKVGSEDGLLGGLIPDEDVVLLYGLIPEHLGKKLGVDFTGMSVLVDKDFTQEHLHIAAWLYEEAMDGSWGGGCPGREQAAMQAVKTARLALA